MSKYGLTPEMMERVGAMFRMAGVIQTLGPDEPIPDDDNAQEVHPCISKFAVMFAKAKSPPKYSFCARMTLKVALKEGEEFDYGLDPKAYLFPLQSETPDAIKRTVAYETRMLSWYAAYAKDVEEVWSLHSITNCVGFAQMDTVFNSIQNVAINVTRSDKQLYHFTLADLPHLNLGDIIRLFKVWNNNEKPLLNWLGRYMQQFLYFYFVDLSLIDRELANFLNAKIEDPDYKFENEKGKHKVGEIVITPNGNGIKVYYEAASSTPGKVHARALVMQQIHLYPDHVLRKVLENVKAVPNKNKRLRADVIERIEWVLEFRRRMLQLPGMCFADSINAIRKKNAELAAAATGAKEN